MEGKYGRLFTEADMERALRAAHDEAFSAGMVEEGAGLEEGDRRRWPPTLATLDEEFDARGESFTFPADEPLFLLRGQDSHAIATISAYSEDFDYSDPAQKAHVENVEVALAEFARFAIANPGRIKEPG